MFSKTVSYLDRRTSNKHVTAAAVGAGGGVVAATILDSNPLVGAGIGAGTAVLGRALFCKKLNEKVDLINAEHFNCKASELAKKIQEKLDKAKEEKEKAAAAK